MGLSYASFLRYRDASRSFSASRLLPVPLNLLAGTEPLRVQGQVVTTLFHHPRTPARGGTVAGARRRRPDDGGDAGRHQSRSLDAGFSAASPFWQGRSLNGSLFTLVGVAPEGFSGTLHGDPRTSGCR